MSELTGTSKYNVSAYGRFLYILACFICLPFYGLVAIPFASSTHHFSISGSLICFAIGVMAWFAAIYSCYQIFRSSPRFVLDDNGFTFNGFFRSKYYKWSDVKRININRGTKYTYIFLLVQLKASVSWKKYRQFDATGLQPNLGELIEEMNRHLSETNNDYVANDPYFLEIDF
jgi:hypothetical protein